MTLADQQVFRDVIGRFASGVTIITTTRRRRPVRHHRQRGQLAVARTADGADLPQQDQRRPRPRSSRRARSASTSSPTASRTSPTSSRARATSSRAPRTSTGIEGIPVLGGTLAHLECRVAETVTGGTHTVFLAHVAVAAGHERRAAHLLPRPLRQAGERSRGGGLRGGAGVGADPAGAARPAVGARRRWPRRWSLEAAARRLRAGAAGGRARREPHRPTASYVPIPLTVELADQLFGARCVIELGVADTCGRATSPTTTSRSSTATRSGWPRDRGRTTRPTLDEFLDTSHGYHLHFVGLGGQPAAARHLRRARHLRAVAPGHGRAGLAHASSTSPTTPRSPGLPRRRRRPRPDS